MRILANHICRTVQRRNGMVQSSLNNSRQEQDLHQSTSCVWIRSTNTLSRRCLMSSWRIRNGILSPCQMPDQVIARKKACGGMDCYLITPIQKLLDNTTRPKTNCSHSIVAQAHHIALVYLTNDINTADAIISDQSPLPPLPV